MVVLARSYSRQSGEMSLDTETGTPGSRSRSSRASARSWAGFAYEKRRLTAMATPATAPSIRRSTAAATRSSSPLGEGTQHGAVAGHALVHAETVAARDERLRLQPLQVVRVLLVDALDVGDVLEAGGGQIDDPRTGALEHGIGADRGAEHQQRHLVERSIEARQHVEHRLPRVVRRRWPLRELQRAGALVQRHQVGEGAPGVDPDSRAHGGAGSSPAPVRAPASGLLRARNGAASTRGTGWRTPACRTPAVAHPARPPAPTCAGRSSARRAGSG